MATLYTQQGKNVRRTWLLMALFLVFVVAIGWFISYYYDNPAILFIAVIFSLVMNITSFWYSDKIALATAGAKPASREQFPELYRAAENVAITAGLPLPALYIIDDPAPNAFATGRNKEHAAIAATTGLLALMNKNELEGVLAHEFSHIGNKDILLQSVVVVLVGFISILAHVFTRGMFTRSSRRGRDGEGFAILAIVGVIFVILSPIVAQIIQLAISRKREFLADTDGALLTRYPEGLASALEKIEHANMPMEKANNATAHLFIANPFGPDALTGLCRLFMTHPPIEERIKILRDMSV